MWCLLKIFGHFSVLPNAFFMVASDLYYDVAYNGELEQSDVFPPLFHFFILSFSLEFDLEKMGGKGRFQHDLKIHEVKV